MTSKRIVRSVLAATLVVVGAGCRGDDDADSSDGGVAGSDVSGADGQIEDTSDPDTWPDDPSSDIAPEEAEAVDFGSIIDGTFVVTGAADAQYLTTNTELAFQIDGGCESGRFGFTINVTDPSGEVEFASFAGDVGEDLSGGVTGEFEADTQIVVIPNGNEPNLMRFDGPLTMTVTEHNAAADSTDQRMTIGLAGSVPSDAGSLDVDATFEWAMACL